MRNEQIREIVWTEDRKLLEPMRAGDRKSRRFIEPGAAGSEDSEQFEELVWAVSMHLKLPQGLGWASGFITTLGYSVSYRLAPPC